MACGGQLQGIYRGGPEAGLARLDLARQPSLALVSRPGVRSRTRHSAPSGRAAPPALCGADDRLDSLVAPAPGDARVRPDARASAVHAGGRARPPLSMSEPAPRRGLDLRLAHALKGELAALRLSGPTAGVAF